jgi:hypothetical protein
MVALVASEIWCLKTSYMLFKLEKLSHYDFEESYVSREVGDSNTRNG